MPHDAVVRWSKPLIQNAGRASPKGAVRRDVKTIQARGIRERIAITYELTRESLGVRVITPLQEVTDARCVSQHQTRLTGSVAQENTVSALPEVAQLPGGTIPCIEITRAHQRCYLFVAIAVEIFDDKPTDPVKVGRKGDRAPRLHTRGVIVGVDIHPVRASVRDGIARDDFDRAVIVEICYLNKIKRIA